MEQQIRRGQVWRHRKTGEDYQIVAVADWIDMDDVDWWNTYTSIKHFNFSDGKVYEGQLLLNIDTGDFRYSSRTFDEKLRVRRVFYCNPGERSSIAWARTEEDFLRVDSNSEPSITLVQDVPNPITWRPGWVSIN